MARDSDVSQDASWRAERSENFSVAISSGRRVELIETIFARVRDDAFGRIGARDATYIAGLEVAVAAAVDYALEGIEQVEQQRVAPVPPAVLEQARRAARIGVSLDTVLRRYVVGHTLLEELVLGEVERGERGSMRRALRAQAAALDRLLTAVSDAYVHEQRQAARPAQERMPALPATLRNPSARRARECLLFLAAHSDSSNREIAAGVGVAHASQISRLLSYLGEERLVSKRSRGAGKRNEWRLTSRGEAIALALEAGRE
jgi:hypothetical protein